MNMREHFHAFYKVLTADETLLRLLYYKPENALDNPLEVTDDKTNILGRINSQELIDSLIIPMEKTEDLKLKQDCSVYMSLGKRPGNKGYHFSPQDIVFEIYVGIEWEKKSQRRAWICDRINDLVFDQRITGMGTVSYVDGNRLKAPENFVAYYLVYRIGTLN